MKLLFVTYCFASHQGQTLIGVYKRGLRLALEMSARGHEVSFYCTGRHAYSDALTSAAEEQLRFVDIPFATSAFDEAEKYRSIFLGAIRNLGPDVIVIGEAPFAGAMLEATLAGVELAVPVVFLDNAYCPFLVDHFLATMGPMADGIILTGPSSHHAPAPPGYLAQVAPFIDSSTSDARAVLASVATPPAMPLVTVLAYDNKVEALGLSLAKSLGPAHIVFCARDPERCSRRLAGLRLDATTVVTVIAQPPEPTLMGLLELSDLAIVKYGFMQVTECLALRTPTIAVYHEGPEWVDFLPDVAQQFVHVAVKAEADRRTIESARHLLELPAGALAPVHAGASSGVGDAADFLDRFPARPRAAAPQEWTALGLSRDHILAALKALHPGTTIDLRSVRAMRLRSLPELDIIAISCGYSQGRTEAHARLWARTYPTEDIARADCQRLVSESPARRILFSSSPDRVLLEANVGEAKLPPVNECDE